MRYVTGKQMSEKPFTVYLLTQSVQAKSTMYLFSPVGDTYATVAAHVPGAAAVDGGAPGAHVASSVGTDSLMFVCSCFVFVGIVEIHMN